MNKMHKIRSNGKFTVCGENLEKALWTNNDSEVNCKRCLLTMNIYRDGYSEMGGDKAEEQWKYEDNGEVRNTFRFLGLNSFKKWNQIHKLSIKEQLDMQLAFDEYWRRVF